MEGCGDTIKSQLLERSGIGPEAFNSPAKTFPATTSGLGVGIGKLETATD